VKRGRRLFTSEIFLRVRAMAYGGYVIPPLSLVKAEGAAIEVFGSETFRVGYYGRQDGLNCVRLVNSKGIYEHWTDQSVVRDNFKLIKLSDETDTFGDNRPVLQSLAQAS
jgi:hypothetical protein